MAEKNTTTANTAPLDEWFPRTEESDQDKLKAKQWQTERRETDDEASIGNLHYGTETERDNLRGTRSQQEMIHSRSEVEFSGTDVADHDGNLHRDPPVNDALDTALQHSSTAKPGASLSAEALSSGSTAPQASETPDIQRVDTNNLPSPKDESTGEPVFNSPNNDRSRATTHPSTSAIEDNSETPEPVISAPPETEHGNNTPEPGTSTPPAAEHGNNTPEPAIPDAPATQPVSDVPTGRVETANSAPHAADDTVTTEENLTISIDVLANDTDVDGTTLTVTEASVQEGAGNVAINDDGTITFDPGTSFNHLAQGETQNVEITYTIDDGQGGTDTTTATVTVTGTNDAVSVVSDSNTTDNIVLENAENGTEVHLTGLATDPDGEAVTYALVDEQGNVTTDSAFTIDTDSGVVTLQNSSQIDFESQSNHTLHIQATSEDGTSSTNEFNVQVGDVEVVEVTDLGGDEGGTAVTFTVTGDHYDPQNIQDVGAGSPRYQIRVNGELLEVEGQDTFSVEANRGHIENNHVVRDGNDVELVTFRVPEETNIDSVSIEFVNDAWDSTTDQDGDGITTEDRNLIVKEINIGGTVGSDGSINGGTTLQAEDTNVSQYIASNGNDVSGRETMPWSGTMTFYPDGVPAEVDSSLFTQGNDNIDLAASDPEYGTNTIYDALDGHDTVTGGSADDTIIGGRGNDTLNGGTGTDTVVFSGNIAEYKIVQNPNNSFTIRDTIDGRDGTDTVADVEQFSFADGKIDAVDLPLSASLIDGAVEGVEYLTSSGIHGFTDENGDFTFKSGDDVTFTVGGVTLGTATAEDVAGGQTFLQDIADVDRTNLNDEYTENLATFLQSLDENSDAYDGIVITDEIRNALANVQIDLQTASEEEVQQVVEQVGKVYVNEDAAMKHVEDMLVANTDLDHEAFQEHRDDGITDSLTAGDHRDSAISSLPDDIQIAAVQDQDTSTMEFEVPSIHFDTPADIQQGDEAGTQVPLEGTGGSGEENNLDSFDVSTGSGADYSAANESLDQFTVSDVDPGMEEIPPMDGLDATPDEEVQTEPEDAGLGADDAVIPDDIQDPAPAQDEVIAA